MADRFPAIAMTDINPAAVRFARINAELNGVGADIRLASMPAGADGLFDAIIAHPPCLIDPDQRMYRDGGADGIAATAAGAPATIDTQVPGGERFMTCRR